MLIGRKVLFLSTATFAQGNPMFQTSLAITIISVAYALHAMRLPFVSPLEQHALVLARSQLSGAAGVTDESGPGTAAAPAAAAPAPDAISVAFKAQARQRRRSSIMVLAASTGAILAHITDFNVLESVLLITCFDVLLGGAVFKSAVFETGDAMDWTLTIVIFSVLLAAFGVFAWMIVQELRRAFAAAAIRAKEAHVKRARSESAATRSAFNRVSVAMATASLVRNASIAALFGARRSGAAPARTEEGPDASISRTTAAAAGGSGSGGGGGGTWWQEWRPRLGSAAAGGATDGDANAAFTMIPVRGPGGGATPAVAAAAATQGTVAMCNPMLSDGGISIRAARVRSMDARRGGPDDATDAAAASHDVKGAGGGNGGEK